MRIDFTRNPAGQITARANSNTVYGPASQTFAYDALGRLTGANVGAATTWTLDDATNWNTRTVAGTPTTYSINGRNQLTAVGATPVTYDNNFSISGGLGVNYTHDQAGRLTAADSTTLTYDAANRLYGVGTGTRFLYAGAQIAGEYDAAGNLTVRHIPGPGLDDVVMSRGALAASRRWPLTDERGSVFAQTEGNSILAGVVEYDAYGASATPLGRFGYTGQPWLPQAAAYHYRARNYLPQVGRFMETDPIGYAGGANLFAYVGADPMNAVDPWGLSRLPHRDGDCSTWYYDAPETGRRWTDDRRTCGPTSWSTLRYGPANGPSPGGGTNSGRSPQQTELDRQCSEATELSDSLANRVPDYIRSLPHYWNDRDQLGFFAAEHEGGAAFWGIISWSHGTAGSITTGADLAEAGADAHGMRLPRSLSSGASWRRGFGLGPWIPAAVAGVLGGDEARVAEAYRARAEELRICEIANGGD